MNLFVIPYNETGWTMPRAEFVNKLVLRWPGAITEETEQALEFQLKTPRGDLYGSFERLGTTQSPTLVIGYYWDWKDCVDLVLWYRSIVSVEQKLIFCDEGYAEKITLEADTTEADLSRAFKQLPT